MTVIVERPKPRLLRHCVAVAAAGLAAAVLSPRPAMALTAAEIANYTGVDRQAVLEAGAKKEGAVQIYSTQVQNKEILEAFDKKYPYIRIEFYRAPGGGSQVARRWVEEYKAGKYLPDLFDGGSTSLPHIAENGGIQPYKSPEMAAMREEGIHNTPQGALWANNYESYLSLGFNTDLVPESEAPRTWDDLLNPKWKGKMALPGSNTLGNFVFALVLDKGEDFVRQLAKQEVKVFKGSGRAVANLVVSGEVPMSPAMFDSHIANSKSQGANVEWRALGGVYSTTGGIALAKYPPHPHAAMLYIDFMLSKKAQEMFREIGYGSARKDIETKSKPSKIYYLGQRPNYAEEFEKWNQFGNRLFGQGVAPPASAGK